MSSVAEFAARLHAQSPRAAARGYVPIDIASTLERLVDIRAVVFDVYGTLIDYWQPPFSNPDRKKSWLQGVFRQVCEHFGFVPFFQKMNGSESAEKTLYDLYHGLIALDHEKSRARNIEYPEVKIERIWQIIIMMLQRYGFSVAGTGAPSEAALAQWVAYFYNFHALGRRLYPETVDALERLKRSNIRLGIVSNAQFYTPIDLTLLLRDQSGGKIEDYTELFDPDLVFFSYEFGIAKPGQYLFQKLYQALYEYHILPDQTVFVGNDLFLDILPARDAGMKTAFFCVDDKSAFLHDVSGEVVPDLVIRYVRELPDLISFHEKTGEVQ